MEEIGRVDGTGERITGKVGSWRPQKDYTFIITTGHCWARVGAVICEEFAIFREIKFCRFNLLCVTGEYFTLGHSVVGASKETVSNNDAFIESSFRLGARENRRALKIDFALLIHIRSTALERSVRSRHTFIVSSHGDDYIPSLLLRKTDHSRCEIHAHS